ncbi:MAG: PH domain-containing protein [Nitrospirae bacterium]|nr:PH domain-containing protein [Nitrospirota bacterium]
MVTSDETAGPLMAGETERWRAYPAWSQFTWLYFLSLITGLRGWIFLQFGVVGGEVWLAGAAILLVVAAVLRHWAQYRLTSQRVIVKNWYTGREIHTMAISDIREVAIMQGPLAQFLGIGTVVLHAVSGDRLLSLRGVSEPEVLKTRIEALLPRGHSALSH